MSDTGQIPPRTIANRRSGPLDRPQTIGEQSQMRNYFSHCFFLPGLRYALRERGAQASWLGSDSDGLDSRGLALDPSLY